jgi:hypothetical protein
MHIRDSILVKYIRAHFKNIGVYKEREAYCYFDVNSITDLTVIIQHFLCYPLLSSKRNAFYIFKTIFDLMKNKQHLNPIGFKLIINYIKILNKPISDKTISTIIF